MDDSVSLALAHAIAGAERALLAHLASALAARGHHGAGPAVIGFRGQLDCGPNHAAEIARRLGVSRQMVSKTVRELEAKGFLSQTPDPEKGNRKVIVFTEAGMLLMSDARAVLAALDAALAAEGMGAELSVLEAGLGRLTAALGRIAQG